MAKRLLWAALAIFIGTALALLPLPVALLALIVSILTALASIDERIALIITLFVAPLKVLLETEIPALAALPLDIGQLMLLFTLVLWLAHTTIRRKKLFSWTPLYLPLFIFILLVLPSVWNTLSLELSIKELAKWIEMLVIIAIVLSLTENSTHWLIAAVIAATCVQATIGIYQFFGGSGAAHFWILDYRHFRAFGSFGNPDPFGGFMSLGLCVAIGALFDSAQQLWSQFRRDHVRLTQVLSLVLAATAVVLLSLGLLFSWSRGAWIGFVAALVVMLLCLPRKMGTLLLAAAIVCVPLALTFQLIPTSIVSRLSDFTQQLSGYDVRGVVITNDNYALVERLAHWQTAILIANEHPWFGVGLGNYPIVYPRYALMNWPLALDHAHNYYLNVLAEAGIDGLIGYLIAVIGILWLLIRTYRRTRKLVLIGILGAWIGLSVHNAFDMLYVNNMYIHIGVLLGLTARYMKFCQSHS